jgi:hypothetical protein
MFRETHSIVSAVSGFVAKRRHTVRHVSANPLRTAHQYHDCRKSNIIDFDLKSYTFIEADVLLTRKKEMRSPQVIIGGYYRLGSIKTEGIEMMNL